ncbi:hypothetical protein Q8F55_004213 [Vanrija albida]|uniref:Uncharacterized protein n=1 Tax=Vanrija albida TaxID=181172 RepID=A0ABR3Q789_9TREE
MSSISKINNIIADHQAFQVQVIDALNRAESHLIPFKDFRSLDLVDMNQHANLLMALIQETGNRVNALNVSLSFNDIITGETRPRNVSFSTDMPGNGGIASEWFETRQAVKKAARFARRHAKLANPTLRKHVRPIDKKLRAYTDALFTVLQELDDAVYDVYLANLKPGCFKTRQQRAPATPFIWDDAASCSSDPFERFENMSDHSSEAASDADSDEPEYEYFYFGDEPVTPVITPAPRKLRRTAGHHNLRAAASAQ